MHTHTHKGHLQCQPFPLHIPYASHADFPRSIISQKIHHGGSNRRLTVADDKRAVDHLKDEPDLVGEHRQLPLDLSHHVCLALAVQVETKVEELTQNVLGAAYIQFSPPK